MFQILKALFISITFGGAIREVTFRLSPFHWKFNRFSFSDHPRVPKRVLNVGPLMFAFRTLCLLLIMGSIAQAQQPYYYGTPPKAIYRQPTQIPMYQPGVRIYYHSQHVPLPGFGTVITNTYRYVPSQRRSVGKPAPYSVNQGRRPYQNQSVPYRR
jgi:hypothetical protein